MVFLNVKASAQLVKITTRLPDGQMGNRVFDFWHTKRVFPFKAHSVLDATAGSTFKNCTFCPHTVFMCFVFISEKKGATFALQNRK
jgi:hypothetical protein